MDELSESEINSFETPPACFSVLAAGGGDALNEGALREEEQRDDWQREQRVAAAINCAHCPP